MSDWEEGDLYLNARLADIQHIARRICGVTNWVPWKFSAAKGGLVCVGAVCPPITRGRNKGQPNYRKADPSTMETVIIPASMLEEAAP
jgi:hypothetical protein